MHHVNLRSHNTPTATTSSGPAIPLLLKSLFRCALQRQECLLDLEARLGVTTGYLAQLTNGRRQTEHLPRPFIEACARYLEVAPVVVQVLAGQLRGQDFVIPELSDEAMAARVVQLSIDATLGELMPASLWRAPREVQHYVLWLYHEARQGKTRSHRLPLLLDEVLKQALQQVTLLPDGMLGGPA